MRELKERDIEKYLVNRVVQLGGEVRKVEWVGRRAAPDRLVMLPEREVKHHDPRHDRAYTIHTKPAQTIFVELKAPCKARTFPADAHERAQHREHERMRRMGQRVEVVDSFEGVEELLQ